MFRKETTSLLFKVIGGRKTREEEMMLPFLMPNFHLPYLLFILIPKIKYFCTLL